MCVQNRPQFVLATPIREFSAGILRRYLYSAKSYAEIAPAKKYLLSYYAREKTVYINGILNLKPLNRILKRS